MDQQSPDNMETLVSIMQKVEKAGFIAQFEIADGKLHSFKSGHSYGHDAVEVIHFYRFEGASSQDDNSVLYAIRASTGEQGTLVDGYGPSGDADVAVFMRKVRGIHK